nr:MAG TPA: hypothetical protein [Caudoviricetes sp.]
MVIFVFCGSRHGRRFSYERVCPVRKNRNH